MARITDSNRAATRWTIRIIPVFIIAVFGLAIYAVVYRLLVQYLYREKGQSAIVAALLFLFFLFFLLTLAAYLRTLFTIQLDPGLVPLLDEGEPNEKGKRKGQGKGRRWRRSRDDAEAAWVPPDPSLDSPGLEQFYSKDVFVCEADGRPKWCSDCAQWKPDRAHHSSELGRCVRKMDHLCPWVGGMVSETSFNFFSQFVFYTTCLCAVSVATAAYCLQQQIDDGRTTPDGWVVAVLVIAAFFGLFTFAMVLTSARYVVTNMTNIDVLRRRHTLHLALRIPRDTPLTDAYATIVYPLQPTPQAADGAATDGLEPSSRDRQATRLFAIVPAEPRENPWDLGFWRNWKSVMGSNVLEWLLPMKHSPCCDHDGMESDYELGRLLPALRARYAVPDLPADGPRPSETAEPGSGQ
ncbi:palmitoyltransferase PFA5 [Drechmeria coniospora]|uniref:Palmitoyltransferase n=1 Tax=Drechmeria coniospora TaxID=98403 RepID=A0A151GIY1_DRECN|nr:palmitoyltransferase PFA5 [Drechmeria coniospora]KYK57039.1 palmitoyltransferase PFA5 [Drechmeria coniospora]